MMPVYGYMDSYPCRGNQTSSAQNHCPTFEAVPPITKVDPSKTVVVNQPWLHPNGFNYSVPCYPCSSDGHFPGYYSHGFYPYSPQPQFHWCGHHPPFPGSFPTQYVPPASYVPAYGYDKPKDNGYHCCGCPNHSHNQECGVDKRIEEREHNMGNKMSLVPSQQQNYPYPVLWIPPEFIKDKELNKVFDGATEEKSPRDMKSHQNVKPNDQQPKERHNWFPFDMKRLQSLLQGDNVRTLDQKDEDTMQQFPFPIIWMNPRQKQSEDDKEEQGKITESPNIVKDPDPRDNVFPVKLLSNGQGMNKAQEIREDVSNQVHSEAKEKSTNQRIIPVKQIDVSKESENSEGAERRGRAVSPKKREDREMGKSSGASTRRGSSSPPKSKLPPVCLRVDPLPRRKSSSVSSRSPSPPGGNGKSQGKPQTCQDSECRESTLRTNKEAEEQKFQGAEVQAGEIKRDERKDEEPRNNSETGIPVCLSVDSGIEKKQQSERNVIESPVQGKTGLEERADESTLKQANEKHETNDASRGVDTPAGRDKKKLSVEEAACLIQSAYRGYQVRKWEPLNKLKQIAHVRDQMVELREKIHSLESSVDPHRDEKQIAVIGEMIMRLLLKLDTIQGLHPSLRSDRKSLAGELVMLQEKLDLLSKATCTEKSSSGVGGNVRDARELPINNSDDILHSGNAVSKNQVEKTSEPPLVVKEEQKETIDDVQLVTGDLEFPLKEMKEKVDENELNSSMVLKQNEAAQETTSQLQSEKNVSQEIFDVQLESGCCNLNSEEEQSELPSAGGSLHMDDSQVSKLEETEEVISKELVASAEEQMDKVIQFGRQNNETDSNKRDLSSLTEIDESDTAAQAVEMLNELPVGVIESEEPFQREAEQQAMLVPDPKTIESYPLLANAEVSNENCSEQHIAEGCNKVASVVGSMDPIKAENEDNDFAGKSILGVKLEQTQATEVSNENSLEETQEASSLLLPVQDDDEMQKEFDADGSNISEANNVIISNVEEAQAGGENQNSVYQPTEGNVNEAELQKQREPYEQETVNISDVAADQPDRADFSKEEVLEHSPMLTEHHEERTRESLSSIAATGKLSTQEHEIPMEDSKKLVEENEKMREMVEKLIQCGKEQLAVISNLTGRMNDLEKKLRQKKMKQRRCRTAISSTSRTPSTKPSTKKQAVSTGV